jgi:hypothetical protein
MSILRGWTPANRAALAALAVAVALAASAALGAWRLDPLPPAAAAETLPPMPVVSPADERDDLAVLTAVARDPFTPERRRAPGRYRMPGEEAPAPAYDPGPGYAETPAPEALRVLGTVVLPDGRSLAAIAGQGAEGRILRVGQSIDGYTLVRVSPGAVTLRGRDTTIVLRTPSGGEQ